MRAAIIGDEISQDLNEVLRVMAEHDITGLELRSVWETPPHQLSDEDSDRIAQACGASLVEIVGFDAPVCKRPLVRTRVEVEEERAVLRRCVEIARRVSAPFIRCFSFYRQGDPEPLAAAEAFARVVDGIDLGGVDLLVETGMRTNTPNIPLTLEFVTAAQVESLQVLWDPGNSVFSGIDLQPFPADWNLGRHLIRHVHVKDPEGSREYVKLGTGDLDWTRILQSLQDDGYDGWLSLETHWRQDRILSQLERDNPWGEAFSRGGGEASAACLDELNRMIRFAERAARG